MSELKAKAIKIIEQFPEERMEYLLRNLESIEKDGKPVEYTEEELRASMQAYEDLHKILRRNNVHFPEEFDYKDEIAKDVLEKYARIG